jgi:hypothetical protein
MVKIVKVHLRSACQKIEVILQQIYPDICIEIVRETAIDFNVARPDLCNDKNDSQAMRLFFERGRIEKEVPCSSKKS